MVLWPLLVHTGPQRFSPGSYTTPTLLMPLEFLKKKNLMGMDLPSRKQHPEFSYTGKVLLLGAGTALKDLGKDLQA